MSKLQDILEELANSFNVYEGKYSKEQLEQLGEHPEDCKCRLCFVTYYEDKIRKAVKADIKSEKEDARADEKKRIVKLNNELKEYFEKNVVSGLKIKEFEIKTNSITGIGLELVPEEPYFEECYEDEKADKDIEALGKKYGFENFGWVYWVYGK